MQNTGEGAKPPLRYSLALSAHFRVWVTVWVRRLTHILTHTIFSVFATKKHRKPKFSMLFGAAGQIRTADLILTKHQVRVGFGPEFVCPDAPYRVIMCKCRKRDVSAFLAAIRELPNKMLLCGYPDYLTFCADLKKKVQTVRDNGGVLTNETDDTTQEAEQESAKGATCEAAR